MSECGWSTVSIPDTEQANRLVTTAAMLAGKIKTQYWYVAQEKTTYSPSENLFGIIRSWDETIANPYEPYSAKPAFLALANWNSILMNAKSLGRCDLGIENLYVYHFKRTDGKDAYVIWRDSYENIRMRFKLNAERVDVYDMYGTQNQISTTDKMVDIDVSRSPCYIVGNIDGIQYDEGNFVGFSKEILEMTKNDRSSLIINNTFNQPIKIEFDLPKNISIESQEELHNQNATKIVFKTNDLFLDDETIKVKIKSKTGSKLLYAHELPVERKESISSKIYATSFRSRRWNCNVTVTNNSNVANLSGKIVFNKPEYMSGKEYTFTDMEPLNTKKYLISVPEDKCGTGYQFAGKIVLDNGEEYSFSKDIYFANFLKIDRQPIIDGVLSPGEWNYDAPFKIMYKEQVQRIDDWGGKNDCGGKVYCQWDNKYFYLAAEIQDDILGDNDEQQRIWACDSIQFAFTEEPVPMGSKRTEYGVGLINGVPKFERYSFLKVDTDIIANTDKYDDDIVDLEIKRDEDKKITFYEARIPWTEIYGDNFIPGNHDEIFFSMIINDNDGHGRRGWLEFCPGIGAVKNTADFRSIPVIK